VQTTAEIFHAGGDDAAASAAIALR